MNTLTISFLLQYYYLSITLREGDRDFWTHIGGFGQDNRYTCYIIDPKADYPPHARNLPHGINYIMNNL